MDAILVFCVIIVNVNVGIILCKYGESCITASFAIMKPSLFLIAFFSAQEPRIKNNGKCPRKTHKIATRRIVYKYNARMRLSYCVQ